MIKTESEALLDILDWSLDRPSWQRDALRRLVSQSDPLTETDVDELYELCKNSSLSHKPLTENDFASQSSESPTVALSSLQNVQNVNALAENQSLKFISKGVTIVYGDNGAGKSGYVRILRSACRARVSSEKDHIILRNIYGSNAGLQKAKLEYKVNENDCKCEWESETPAESVLSEISVFDSRVANIHVEEENSLAYTPHPMKIMERLVDLCTLFKKRLEDEIVEIKKQTPEIIANPACSNETEVGKFLSKVKNGEIAEEIPEINILTKDEETLLAQLSNDMNVDQKETAENLRSIISRLSNFERQIKKMDESTSKQKATELQTMSEDLRAKKSASRLASKELSNGVPLEGVGSDVWKLLWDAARKYSTQFAYSGESFPVVSSDSRCVLCQQELSESSKARLKVFEEFIQDEVQKNEKAANEALASFREEISDNAVSMKELREGVRILRDEVKNSEIAELVRLYAIKLKLKLRSLLRANYDLENEHPVPGNNLIQQLISSLNERMENLGTDEEKERQKSLMSKFEELRDRKWFEGIKVDVLAEIERKKRISHLQSAIESVHSISVTKKNTVLSKALITERLRNQFAHEIEQLNLTDLKVEIEQATGQYGISRFRLNFSGTDSSNAGEILSEGEHRCVAFAGFMAEIVTNNNTSAIILDDPVSSLDHLHREVIAKRLANEGCNRQIVVFTHDLPFLFMLRNACAEEDDPSLRSEVALRHVQKRQQSPGYCRNEPPEKAQDAMSRVISIKVHLKNCKVQYENDPDSREWLTTGRGILDDVRQAWECAVEEAVSPVLRTFQNKVNTKGFKKLSAITEEDANVMRSSFGRCSKLLHNASLSENPVSPKPEKIGIELEVLETWLTDVIARQKVIKVS